MNAATKTNTAFYSLMRIVDEQELVRFYNAVPQEHRWMADDVSTYVAAGGIADQLEKVAAELREMAKRAQTAAFKDAFSKYCQGEISLDECHEVQIKVGLCTEV